MSTVHATPPDDHRPVSGVPAYGPIEAILGFVVFYVFVSRATQTFVEVVPTAFEGLAPSAVTFGLAVVLWVAFAAAVLEQVRRQVVAARIGSPDDAFQAAVSTRSWALGYGVLLAIGGWIAWVTFDRAVEAGIAAIRLVVRLDVSAVEPLDAITLVAFFIAFGLANRAVDRLVIGGVRALRAG